MKRVSNEKYIKHGDYKMTKPKAINCTTRLVAFVLLIIAILRSAMEQILTGLRLSEKKAGSTEDWESFVPRLQRAAASCQGSGRGVLIGLRMKCLSRLRAAAIAQSYGVSPYGTGYYS